MTVIANNACKRVSISSKRQITIPNIFFNELGFENEAMCILKDNELIIRPVNSDSYGEFAEEILADLIKEGYTGEKMLREFKARQSKIKTSINKILQEADDVANNRSEYMTMKDVFGGK